MKFLMTLGAATAALISLMAFVGGGSASATELTCTEPLGTKVMCLVGTEIHIESEGKMVMDTPIGNVECLMALEGEIAATGSSTSTVSIPLSAVPFKSCNVGVGTVNLASWKSIHETPALMVTARLYGRGQK